MDTKCLHCLGLALTSHFLGCQIMDKCSRFPKTPGSLWPSHPFPGVALERFASPQVSIAIVLLKATTKIQTLIFKVAVEKC